MNEFISALFALLTFKPYTTLDRWFEIGSGVISWVGLITILWAVLKQF